ncbi:hypothetical protein Strain138_001960 [Pseudogemmatithrix spongiicola]|uniref:Uncharacterized protein n=1 Tax=Pseudogemmatithrix spongiicola TaxID=3062599 RepID=A0AA49Q7C0_9BACT|nr:hypothetical protein Strain138_001960 [Gemmatimonadaceae bacterium 'strain 138']WKW15568.1 hypothetical protein Strain318_001959 [Gemmatimonadaceae bacterium 'strain 318']
MFRRPVRRLAAIAVMLGAALAPDARAQDIAAIEDSVAALRLRSGEARAQLAQAEARLRSRPDDSLVFSGAVVRFTSADVPAAERRRLAAAFATADRELQAELGDVARTLLAETRWQLTVLKRPGALGRPFVSLLPATRRSESAASLLRFPLSSETVVRIIKNGVGDRIVARHAAFGSWLGGSLFLRDRAEMYYGASRDLVLRGTTRSRRCARGDVRECTIILDPARRDEWYTEEDTRRNFPPASAGVRATLFMFVMERAGPQLVTAMDAAPADASPIAVLASAASLDPDQLITQWQAAISSGGEARARVSPAMGLTSLAWILVFGLVATRRRPR